MQKKEKNVKTPLVTFRTENKEQCDGRPGNASYAK